MVRTIISILVSLAAAALLCGSATAKDRAAEAKVYEGAVGSSSIVMSLERSDGSVSGSYFYRAKRFDIDLTGEEKNGAVQLESHLTGEKVSLKPDGSGYVGSLTTAKGKTLHVRVKAVGPDAASAAPARHRRWARSLRKYTVLTRPHEWRNGIVACADVADFIVKRIEADSLDYRKPEIIRYQL